jgi:hypothetical protein
VQPQYNKSTGFKFSYQQGLEQLSPQLNAQKPAAEGQRNRCKFGTFGNANDTSYNGQNYNELQKVNEQPHHNGNMASPVWKRFWWYGARQQ